MTPKAMRRGATLALAMVVASTPVAQAGLIERACLSSDRRAGGDTRLCACIQIVADQVLTPSEQRLGAGFFKNPDRSQEVRQSDNAADAVFWEKWKAYGEAASEYCR